MSLSELAPPHFVPQLIIFDKDGTLIDFNFMWAEWIKELARRLEAAAGIPLKDALFRSVGFDCQTEKVTPGGPLAILPMAEMQNYLIEFLEGQGLTDEAAARAVANAWYLPDPVKLARPLADIPYLFRTLRARGIKVAVATSDDRAGTEATLAGLGALRYVDAFVGADDGLRIKPEPDVVLHLCRTLGVDPAATVVVGDNVVDLEMARAAGVGLVVGVLSGLSSRERLMPHADVVIPSIADLVELDN